MFKHNKTTIQYTLKNLKQLVKKVCYQNQISQYHFKFGPKKYTQPQFVALLILCAKSGKSLREFIKYLYESKWPEWLKLKEIPSKSSLHSHFQRIGLKIIRELNNIIVDTKEVMNYAIDSTGIDAHRASKHYEKRINRIRVPFLKLSILSQSEKPYLINDFSITNTHLHDVNHAKSLSKRFLKKGKIIFADKAYDCEELMNINYKKGNKLYAPTRNFKVSTVSGKLRRKMNEEFDKKTYNKGRNPVEMIMFLLKVDGLIIRAKKIKNQIKELAWKILAYNLKRLSECLFKLYYLISLDKALFTETFIY